MGALFATIVLLSALICLVSTFVYLFRKLLRKNTGHTGAIAVSSFGLCIVSFIGVGITINAEKSQKSQTANHEAVSYTHLTLPTNREV